MTDTLEATLTAERSALGACILDMSGRQARILTEFVGERDWISSLNRAVFVAIRSLVARDCLPLDYNNIIGELQRTGVFEQYASGWRLISSLGEGIVLSKPMTKRINELRGLWDQHKELAAAK
jgi:hypothetical protein